MNLEIYQDTSQLRSRCLPDGGAKMLSLPVLRSSRIARGSLPNEIQMMGNAVS